MNIFSKIGASIVIFALASYSIAIVTEQRKRLINRIVLVFLTIGVILDIVATTFMIIGSSHGPFTLHGLLGYSSLTAMLIDTILIWRFNRKNSTETLVPKALHVYSLAAYLWWVAAFITGLLLVVFR
jgi:hypothetical protein